MNDVLSQHGRSTSLDHLPRGWAVCTLFDLMLLRRLRLMARVETQSIGTRWSSSFDSAADMVMECISIVRTILTADRSIRTSAMHCRTRNDLLIARMADPVGHV